MKLVTFRKDGLEKIGILEGEAVVEILSLDKKPVTTMLEVIRALSGDTIDFSRLTTLEKGAAYLLSQVDLAAPIPWPLRNLFCLGMNYVDHAKEVAFTEEDKKPNVPKFPIYFSKLAHPAKGDGGDLIHDAALSEMLDYEVELAVIIGKKGKNIPREEALEYVFGYTIANDISARNLQGKHGQWFKGKSVDGYAPMGPYILTADQLPDPSGLQLQCYVNEELRQNANTKDMVFSVPEIISDLSRGLTLHPGDIILTGTPAGVGLGFKPYKFIFPGDVVRCKIDQLGTLTTYIK